MSIKIEVGKIYINDNGTLYEIFYHDKKHNIFYGRCVNNLVYVVPYREDGRSPIGSYSLIEERKEPFKNEITGWIGYGDCKPEKDGSGISDNLLKRISSTYIHNNKENVAENWNKSMHVKITVEEIID